MAADQYAAPRELPALTSLRFLAAMEVVAYHWETTSTYAPGGYEAVTFFFVLSGFILTHVYSQRSASKTTFWRARFARIAPAYYFALLIALPAFVYSALVAKIVPIREFSAGLVLVPLALQAFWPPTALTWNIPAWSLSVEFLFYALFPWLLPASAKANPYALLLAAFGLVLLTSLARGALLADYPRLDAYFPLVHLPQFMFGIALARVRSIGKPLPWLLWIGLAGTVGLFAVLRSLPDWAHSTGVIVPLFGLVIYGAADSRSKVLSHPVSVLLGEASYAVYILHSPLSFWWKQLTERIVLPTWLETAGYFALVILASVLTYRWIERPCRQWLLDRSRQKVLNLA